MKKARIAIALAVALVAGLEAPSAFAWRHGPRVSFGFYFGVPVGPYPYSYYYYPPYYYPAYFYPPYYAAPFVMQQQPTVYVEQQPAPAAPPSAQPSAPAGYWYYCAASRAYYPYVKECPAGWQRVPPYPG